MSSRLANAVNAITFLVILIGVSSEYGYMPCTRYTSIPKIPHIGNLGTLREPPILKAWHTHGSGSDRASPGGIRYSALRRVRERRFPLLIIPLCSMSPKFLKLLKRGHENASRGSLANPPLASICA